MIRRITAVAAGALLFAAVTGCESGPEPLTPELEAQHRRIFALRKAMYATKFPKSAPGAERSVEVACAAFRALKTEGEVRRAVTEIDQHPGFLAQIALRRKGSVHNQADGRTIVARPQVYLIAVRHVLMRIEVEALYREVRDARREMLLLEQPLRLLADDDFRVAVSAPETVPPHYLSTPAITEFVRARALEHLETAGLSPAVLQRTLDSLPLLFPPAVTSDLGEYAAGLLEEFLNSSTAQRTAGATWLIDALAAPELPQIERLLLLRRLLRDSDSVDELLTVFDAQAMGAGLVMRKLGLSKSRHVRAATAMVLPPGSQVIPARALLGSEGVALAALQEQLSDPAIAVRAAAALAWEGVPGIDLGDYDPRASDADLATALDELQDRIETKRAEIEAAKKNPGGKPTGAGAGDGGLNPFAKPKQPKAEPPSKAKRMLMKRALRAAGLLLDDFVRQVRREPASMMDVYEAYRRSHPWGGCHDAGDGRLLHEPSTFHLDVRDRPDGKGLTVIATPPPGGGGRSYWWDKIDGRIRLVPEPKKK